MIILLNSINCVLDRQPEPFVAHSASLKEIYSELVNACFLLEVQHVNLLSAGATRLISVGRGWGCPVVGTAVSRWTYHWTKPSAPSQCSYMEISFALTAYVSMCPITNQWCYIVPRLVSTGHGAEIRLNLDIEFYPKKELKSRDIPSILYMYCCFFVPYIINYNSTLRKECG